ncbi:DUF551 domain-containing protein [Acinetobacter sp. NIPH 817]|uniref:DUF551 domain-containing protein n=1 Tax=Acinetobacter sp. NIPH 817 TaxID=520708 RepID=UPI0002CEB00E|nr:DUF551 domain-containing protein [Acinetobacter sp. NIPH 817]ENV03446.1 hypothetical protein F968_01100 [Acinetobacter sp. NIPH 817]
MIDLKTKQAFWVEQLPIFKEKYWLPDHLEVLKFDMIGGCFELAEGIKTDFSEDDLVEIYHRVNSGWAMWKKAVIFMREKAEAQAVTRWISVNDRLPTFEELVLIKTNKGTVQGYLFQDEEYSEMKGEYIKFDGWQDDFHDDFIEYEDVTHWMKLPNGVSDSGPSGFKYQIQPMELPENLFNWFHPDIELFDTIEEGTESYTKDQWKQLQLSLGVKIETQLLDYDEIPNIPEDAVVWPNWKPEPPEQGLFLIAAFDSEDGPVLWWANPKAESKEGDKCY